MKNRTKKVEIKYIEFENNQDAMENKNYPSSGLFMVRTIKPDASDLRFVDKRLETNFCLVPEAMFEQVIVEVYDSEKLIQEKLHEIENTYKGDFILEFARILLNRK